MDDGAPWCQVVVIGADGGEVGRWTLRGAGALDLRVVEALARSQLAARRAGGAIRLRHVSEELVQLLELVGLRREVGGEAEGGEQVVVEEGVEARDPLA